MKEIKDKWSFKLKNIIIQVEGNVGILLFIITPEITNVFFFKMLTYIIYKFSSFRQNSVYTDSCKIRVQ